VPLLRRWLPVVVWAAVIFTFSTSLFSHDQTSAIVLPLLGFLFPNARPEELRAMHAAVRKLAHFSEYLVLSVLLYRALRAGRRWELRTAAVALGLAGLYAITDEVHQVFVPGRTAAALDCLIDFSGAAAGQGLVAAARRAPRV